MTALVVLVMGACGQTGSIVVGNPSASPQSKSVVEFVGGHWIAFSSAKPLSLAQWAVVDGYANFSFAVLAVYATHSVAPLETVVSTQSKVSSMFAHDLALGTNPESLYTRATVEAVSISGCRARLSEWERNPLP